MRRSAGCSVFLSESYAFSLPHQMHRHTHKPSHTHSSNYGNQQADPISVSCLLSPRGWLPDHLTLHNLICIDRVWHPDFWPYQQLVCVYVFVHVSMCETPPCVWLRFFFLHSPKLLPGSARPERSGWRAGARYLDVILDLPPLPLEGLLSCLSCLKTDGHLC